MRIALANKRKELNYSQQDIADKLGVSRTTVSGWELGRNEPNLKMIIKLKEILHISDDRFFLNASDTK